MHSAPAAIKRTYTDGYQVGNSLLLQATAQAQHLHRTPTITGNSQKWTLSVWVKRVRNGSYDYFLSLGIDSSASEDYGFHPAYTGEDQIFLTSQLPSLNYRGYSDGEYRDTSDWMHIVIRRDASLATEDEKTQLFVDGQQISIGHDQFLSGTQMMSQLYKHKIGRNAQETASGWSDLYYAEYAFLDDQYLDPTEFGEWNSTYKTVWQPRDLLAGHISFGGQSYYLNFADEEDLGNDVSGLGNHWTSEGITSSNQRTDTPVNKNNTMNVYSVKPPSNSSSWFAKWGGLQHGSTPVLSAWFICLSHMSADRGKF